MKIHVCYIIFIYHKKEPVLSDTNWALLCGHRTAEYACAGTMATA